MIWFAPHLGLFAHALGCLACWSVQLCLSSSVPLHPLVGLRSPSVSYSFSFILSFHLTMPTDSHSATVENTTPEGVLSQCWCHGRGDQSRSSQGYISRCGCHDILIPFPLTACSCRISLMCHQLLLNFLCSLVLTLTLFVIHSSWITIDPFLHKMAIFIKNWPVEQKNHCLLLNWPAWALCSQPVFRLDAVVPVDLCISVPNPLLLYFYGSTTPFGRPSASLEFRHSLAPPLYACYIYLCSVQDTTPEGVLSECGCSLILTLTTSMGI